MSERVTNWPTNWPREIAELKAERDVLREQIQRVREIRTPSVGLWPERPDAWFNGYAAALEVVLRAIDGDSDE